MEKRKYIQPEMEVALVAMSELMVPGGGSPTSGGMDPLKPAPARTPALPTDTVVVF